MVWASRIYIQILAIILNIKLLLDVHEKTFNILKKTKDLMVDCSVILKKTNILKPDDIENIINSKYPYIWDFIKKNDG